MATIKGGETRDIFAPNYGFTPIEWEYHEGWTIAQYVEENYDNSALVNVAINLAHYPDDYIVKSTDCIGVGVDIGEAGFWAGVGAVIKMIGTWMAAHPYWAFVIQVAAGTAFGMLVNMLLAPDAPGMNGASTQDTSNAYQWGGLSNTSDQMIPINVSFGEMMIAGNLIGVRTEARNINSAGYSIRDTAYFLYGLTSNTLSSIEEVYLNDIPISEFDEDDISVYYTLGTSSQNPINTLSSLSMLTDDTSAPASDGIMFPSLVTETVVNQELDTPNHMVDLTESASVIIGYEKSQSSIPNITEFTLVSNLSAATTTTFTVKYSTLFTGNFNTEILALDKPFYASMYTATDYWMPETTEDIVISNITLLSSVDYIETFTLTISARYFPQAFITSTARIAFYYASPLYQTYYEASTSGSDIWNAQGYIPSTSWTEKLSTNSNIEDVELEFTHPRGLYFVYSGSHSGNDAGSKFTRWETYDFHVIQYNSAGDTIIADTLFEAPDDGTNLTFLAAMRAGTQTMPRGFFAMGTYTSAHTWSLKMTDIIRGRHNVTYAVNYSTTDGHIPLLNAAGDVYSTGSLDGYTYLETGYKYMIKTRIHGHGNSNRDGILGYWTFDPQGVVAGNETDVYGTVLYRFKELNYDEILSYPHTSLLAIAANATPTMNNSMPKITAKIHAEILVGVVGTKYTPSAWTPVFNQNPAWIALTALWNNVWGGNIGEQIDADFISKVDMDTWFDFATYCDTTITDGGPLNGEANYTFNGTFDTQTTLLEAVNKIVAVANAVVIFNGSKLSVYWENDTIMTQVFSPGNIVADSLTLEYLNAVDTANAVSGNFVDSGNNYEKTAISWIYPNSDPRKSTSIELIGITENQRVLRALQYKLNKTNLIKVQYSLKVLSDAIASQQGDIVGIENEFIEFGAGGGRLKGIEQSTGEITLDRIYEEPAGTSYITIRNSENEIYPTVTTNWVITNWATVDGYTVVTVGNTTELAEVAALDIFVIGVGSDICRKAVINTIDINNDYTCSIIATGYVPFSDFDSGMFTLSTTQLQGITQEYFSPRNIKCDANSTLTAIDITWTGPLIELSTEDNDGFVVYRYTVWRRQGSNAQWDKLGEVESQDKQWHDEAALGSVYYYKVLPVFNYYGSEATIPMSWCSNFTETSPPEADPADYTSGNIDVATGVDFTWSVYEYLPKPVLGTVTDSNGYLVTINQTNETLCDLTIFIENPDDWLRKDKTEGFGFWLKTSTNSNTNWIGPTNITLSGNISASASSLVVSSITGLCIPGLILIDERDLVYVTGSTTTLTVPYTSLTRKFSVGVDHASGVSVRNAHLGFNPIKYFVFQDDITVVSAVRQLSGSTIYKYDQITNTISNSTWGSMITQGIDKYRLVQGISNTVTYIDSITASSVIMRGDIPEKADFVITSSHHDAFGSPISVYAVMWEWEISKLMLNSNNEIYFTIQAIPPFEYAWFGLTRYSFPTSIENNPQYGWTSFVTLEGI